MKLKSSFMFGIIFWMVLPASAEMYRYVDDKGVTRFTNDLSTVPESKLSKVVGQREYQDGTTGEKPIGSGKSKPSVRSHTVYAYSNGISITSPDNRAVITRKDVMVEGSFTNPSGRDTGIIIMLNGVAAGLAHIYSNQFVANHVPLQPGKNTLTVKATDTAGVINTAEILVMAERRLSDESPIRLLALQESGVAPFETTLRMDGSFSFTAHQPPSYTGPGTVEFLESSEENEFKVRMTTEGVYYFTAKTISEGVTCTDTVAVVVVNQGLLDAKLKAVFSGVKTALAAGDVEKAASFFTLRSREKYRVAFNSLSGKLPQISSDMQDIELIDVLSNIANYRIYRPREINGEMVNITYFIRFRVDVDGIWRIEQY